MVCISKEGSAVLLLVDKNKRKRRMDMRKRGKKRKRKWRRKWRGGRRKTTIIISNFMPFTHHAQ